MDNARASDTIIHSSIDVCVCMLCNTPQVLWWLIKRRFLVLDAHKYRVSFETAIVQLTALVTIYLFV